MKFISVHRANPAVSFREALFTGLAPDGGLYIPESIPVIGPKFLKKDTHDAFADIGKEFIAPYIDDIPQGDLGSIVHRAWTFPIPLIRLEGNIFLLELFHGPTLAFKDIGARFMAEIMSYYLSRESRRIAILVATSGDTGSAVAHGFHNVPLIDVYILYPSGGISQMQEQQMTTLGGNIHAIEISGTFDDCQRLVKQSLADKEMQSARTLTTANSINVGRLIPQIAYYAQATSTLRHGFSVSTKPVVVVPSGNLGNLTAGVYAKRMGIPIERFIAATNANDILPVYLKSGKFTPRSSIRTFSNAMDVGNPSNFARLEAFYGSPEMMRSDLWGMSFSDDETLLEIQRTYKQTGYILDPHSAIGVAAARHFMQSDPHQPFIVMATANPAKFPEVIRKAISLDIPFPASLEKALQMQKQSVRLSSTFENWKRHFLQ